MKEFRQDVTVSQTLRRADLYCSKGIKHVHTKPIPVRDRQAVLIKAKDCLVAAKTLDAPTKWVKPEGTLDQLIEVLKARR